MSSIFISYRRDDSAGWAGRLATDLQGRFGPDAVFQDIDTIAAGKDFINEIDKALASCAAVLVLIGPDWCGIQGKDGGRRLDDPSDTVRLEIAKALRRQGVLVIPVLLGGASMPDADDLPTELELLARRNAFELSDKRWDYDLLQLVDTLVRTAGLTPVAKPANVTGAPSRMLWLLGAMGALLLLSVVGLGYYFLVIQADKETTFELFSIDRPANNEVLPLGKHRTWMLEGRLPLADDGHVKNLTPSINIEVFKLPERQPVPQEGRLRISTERGLWRFETAHFPGDGAYEILATADMNGWSDWHSVMVKCMPKGTAFQQAIAKDRDIRGASSLSQTNQPTTELPALKRELYALQQEFFELFPHDLDGAEDNLTRTFDLLDPALPLHPNDMFLQNMRAYTLKNYAMVMRNRGKSAEFHHGLREAERMFQAIREQEPNDAGAWNGLGSVALLQDDPKRALAYIDRALEINPNYKAAQHDRSLAMKRLKQQDTSDVNRKP